MTFKHCIFGGEDGDNESCFEYRCSFTFEKVYGCNVSKKTYNLGDSICGIWHGEFSLVKRHTYYLRLRKAHYWRFKLTIGDVNYFITSTHWRNYT